MPPKPPFPRVPVPTPPTRVPAPHLQAALASVAQAKLSGGARPLAAHVRNALTAIQMASKKGKRAGPSAPAPPKAAAARPPGDEIKSRPGGGKAKDRKPPVAREKRPGKDKKPAKGGSAEPEEKKAPPAPTHAEPANTFDKGTAAGTRVLIHKDVIVRTMGRFSLRIPRGFVQTGSLDSYALTYTPNVIDFHISFRYPDRTWADQMHYALRDIQPGAAKNAVLYWWYELVTADGAALAWNYQGYQPKDDVDPAPIATLAGRQGVVLQGRNADFLGFWQAGLAEGTFQLVEFKKGGVYNLQFAG